MNQKTDIKQLRNFGLMVGGIFLVIGIWPIIVGGTGPKLWALILGGALVTLGLLLPRSLGQVYRAWMILGHALGWINTRIILGIVFYGILTPMGLVMRFFGKDLLHLHPEPQADTYRVFRQVRPKSHLKHQF